MNRKSWIIVALIWLAVAAAGTYIRLYPLRAHIWSPTQDQATVIVVMNIKKSILDNIHRQHPTMPPELALRLTEEKLNETLRTQTGNVRRAIEMVNEDLYRRNKTSAPLYLLESDPYYYYMLTQNIVENGRMAETMKGNKYFDPLMRAPEGAWQPRTLHPYMGFVLYKIMAFFNPKVPLMTAVAFVPLLIVMACAGLFVWAVRLLGCSYPAIGVGALYFIMTPIFLKRSALGWYDTDPYNVLFSLACLGLLFLGTARPLIAGMALGIALTAYSLFWHGWGFIFIFTLMCLALTAGFTLLPRRNQTKNLNAAWTAAAVAVTVIACSTLIYGMHGFLDFFTDGLGELQKFTIKGLKPWPNLFIEVGELNKSSLTQLISDTGGLLMAVGAGLGIIFAWRRPTPQILVLTAFLAMTVLLTCGAERFSIFAFIPLALFFTLGVDVVLSVLNKNWTLAPWLRGAIIVILIAAGWTQAQTNISRILTPIFNSTWEQALTTIKDKTPIDAIINTWWPPGHFIKAIAQRRVPFDGASLSESATGYWMANILLSTNEDHAQGLLRMLNSSGNKAVDFCLSRGLSLSQSVAVLHAIAPKDRPSAANFLTAFLDPAAIQQLLALTHDGTPHSYVLIYTEIVDQNIGLVFAARWNFQKIEMINANPTLLKAVPKANSPAFINFLWDLAGGPPHFSEALSLINRDGDMLRFKEGIVINARTLQASIDSPKYGHGAPQFVEALRDGEIVEQHQPNASLKYAAILYDDNGTPACRLMDEDLARSLLIKLYYFNGAGLKNFQLLTSVADDSGRTQIKIFKTKSQ